MSANPPAMCRRREQGFRYKTPSRRLSRQPRALALDFSTLHGALRHRKANRKKADRRGLRKSLERWAERLEEKRHPEILGEDKETAKRWKRLRTERSLNGLRRPLLEWGGFFRGFAACLLLNFLIICLYWRVFLEDF